MSFHSHSPVARSSSIPPAYSFDELQDIWNLQKEILNKYKSSQVPFVILDQDNTGVISSKDFPYRLVARGFPCNTALYLKFFAFLDTNQDGYINMEDWIEGFKSISERLVDTRCKAREELKAASLIAHSRNISSIDGYNTTPAKYAQNSFEPSSQKSWASPKNLETNAVFLRNNLVEQEDEMERISLGLNNNGRRFSTEPNSSVQKQERKLQIDTSDTHKEAAMRINQRVDSILKNIETRKNLLNGATPKIDSFTPSSQFQNVFTGLKNENLNRDSRQRSEDIHQTIKRSSSDAIGAIRTKLGLGQTTKESTVNLRDELGAYTPSVTSITGAEEDPFAGKILRKNSEEKDLQFTGIENSLRSKVRRKNSSPQESKRSLNSQSSSALVEEGISHFEKVTKALAAKRKNNGSQSIAIPPFSGSEKNLDTPSWKDFPARSSKRELEEGAVLEMMENILETYGNHDRALRSLKKEDLIRFPRLRMFVASLNEHTPIREKVYRRQFGNGVRKRSRTKSMIELRVKGDLVKEIEMEVQRRRAITPQISARNTTYNETARPRTPDRIANAEKMIESLKEFAKKSIIMRRKTSSQKVGIELAKEILEGKSPRNGGGIAIYNRVQEKLKGDKQAEEAKRNCREVMGTLGSRRKEIKRSREDALSNVGYSIQLDAAKNSFMRRESDLIRKEDKRGIEDDKRFNLRRAIDQLSNEAASMEASLSKSRNDLKKPLQESTESRQRLLNLMTPNTEINVGKLLVPEKRRVKSFIRGSISSSSSTNIGSEFNLHQSNVETKLMDRLNQTKPVNRYSKLASDLGTLSVSIDKPDRRPSISPFTGTRTSKNSSISVSSLLKEEFLGRGKSFLQSDYSGMSSILKDLATPLTTKSSIRVGFNKF